MAFSFLYIRYEIEFANEKTVDLNIFEAYAILVFAWICLAVRYKIDTGFARVGQFSKTSRRKWHSYPRGRFSAAMDLLFKLSGTS